MFYPCPIVCWIKWLLPFDWWTRCFFQWSRKHFSLFFPTIPMFSPNNAYRGLPRWFYEANHLACQVTALTKCYFRNEIYLWKASKNEQVSTLKNETHDCHLNTAMIPRFPFCQQHDLPSRPAAVGAAPSVKTLLERDGGTRLGFTSRCLLFVSLVFLTLFHHLFISTPS